MLVIEIDLLTGRYVATAHDDRRRAEWPPHPARFFSALVAALHDREKLDQSERGALLWLEQQPPPSIAVDLDAEEGVGRRDVHDVFVPVNDVSTVGNVWALASALRESEQGLQLAETLSDAKRRTAATKAALRAKTAAEKRFRSSLAKALTPIPSPTASDLAAAVALLPERRTRQMRTFPVVTPACPVFSFQWAGDPPDTVRRGLQALCERVTRLGHPSSLVRCSVVDAERTPSLVPAQDGTWVLRVVSQGQLERLEAAFARHQAVESRVLPARPARYSRPGGVLSSPMPRSVFGNDWILYERRAGARLLSSRGPDLARALRGAVLEANGANGALPPILSGHDANGRPSHMPHLAFVSCPFVGHPHADGSVQGCAIVMPRDISEDDRRTLFKLVANWEKLTQQDGLVELAAPGLPPGRYARVTVPEKQALLPSRWCRASMRFTTATPIALDRHPGNLRSNVDRAAHRAAAEAQDAIARACERIGLPRPVSVEVSLTPLLPGAQPVRDFHPWPQRPGQPQRARVHAEIRFDRAVRGPVILGAGRYFGLGLCLPNESGN